MGSEHAGQSTGSGDRFAMNEIAVAGSVLACYPGNWSEAQIEYLGCAGGFSGAAIWRVRTPKGQFCLKRWPEAHPAEAELRFMHAVLLHVSRQGLDWTPAPLANRWGATWTVVGGHFWELTAWMPGEADFHQDPRPARLQAALQALARFHRAAETFPAFYLRSGVPPSILERRARLHRLAAGGLDELRRDVVAEVWPELFDAARAALGLIGEVLHVVRLQLDAASRWETPLQPCIRDVWHDHLLFTGDRVTGLIDFGSLRVDCVATDVARLLGSLAGDDDSLWKLGLEAYESVRPLGDLERAMVAVLDSSGTLLAAVNWIEWLYRDRRRFAARDLVRRRVQGVFERLKHLPSAYGPGSKTGGGLWLPG